MEAGLRWGTLASTMWRINSKPEIRQRQPQTNIRKCGTQPAHKSMPAVVKMPCLLLHMRSLESTAIKVACWLPRFESKSEPDTLPARPASLYNLTYGCLIAPRKSTLFTTSNSCPFAWLVTHGLKRSVNGRVTPCFAGCVVDIRLPEARLSARSAQWLPHNGFRRMDLPMSLTQFGA